MMIKMKRYLVINVAHENDIEFIAENVAAKVRDCLLLYKCL